MTKAFAQLRQVAKVITDGLTGEWYVGEFPFEEVHLKATDIFNQTGATVLAVRHGAWQSDCVLRRTELLLKGTPEQISQAQERFGLLPVDDSLLDQPEQYWG